MLLAAAVLLAHCILTRFGMTALAVVATLLRWASLWRPSLWGANGLLPNLGLLRTGGLRLRLALLCSLDIAALASLDASFVLLLPVAVAAAAVLRCGGSHAYAKRDTQSKRPCGTLASVEFHEVSL